MHSTQCRWVEVQKQLRRIGVDHDTSIDVGEFGDKAWAEWVIQKLVASASEPQLPSCEGPLHHLPEAAAEMTNQSVTNGPAGWGAWWEANKTKTQVQWIRDGFAKQGIILNEPLTTNDIIALLQIRTGTNFGFAVYNARRWLRDSGFTPSKLNLETVPASERDSVAKSLVSYAQWYGVHWDDPGKLDIPGSPANGWQMTEPMIVTKPFKAGVAIVLMTMMFAGVLLVRRC